MYIYIYIIGIYNLQPRSYSLDFLGIQRRGGRGSWRCRSRKSRRGTHGGAERGTRGNPQGRGSAPSWAMGPWEIMGMCWVDSVDHGYNMDIMVDPVSWCMICSQEVSLTCFKNKKKRPSKIVSFAQDIAERERERITCFDVLAWVIYSSRRLYYIHCGKTQREKQPFHIKDKPLGLEYTHVLDPFGMPPLFRLIPKDLFTLIFISPAIFW